MGLPSCCGWTLTYSPAVQLDAAGIRPSNSAKRLQREAAKAWLVGLLFSTVSGIYSLFQLQQRQQTMDKKEGEGLIESKKLERYVSRPSLVTEKWSLEARLTGSTQGTSSSQDSAHLRPL